MAGGNIYSSRPFLTYRTDANQAAISKKLRKLGYKVKSTHKAGDGFTDLVIAKSWLNIIAEVKDGSKIPSARCLDKTQRKFYFSWTGLKCVLTCERDCEELDKQVMELLNRVSNAGIKMYVTGSTDAIYFPALTFEE